jgi:hypothetical protein
MRLLLLSLLIAFSGMVLADNGQTDFAVSINPHGGHSDDIVITLLATHTITYTTDVLGLSIANETNGAIIFVGEDDDVLYAADPIDASYEDELALHSGNTNAYGVANDDTYLFCVNDWSDTFIYEYQGGWTLSDNPAGNDGRGMDYDGTWWWQAVSDGSSSQELLAFQPGGGTTYTYDVTSYVPGQLSGCVAWWESGDLYIGVTCYSTPNIYVFYIDGSSHTYVGSAALPEPASTSHGLGYSEARDSFYWSWTDGGWYITEFEMDLNLGLEPATWGHIKSEFAQ